MSQQLIDRSSDLKRLRQEGYDIEIRAGYLLVKDIPYVNATGQVRRGTLVSELTLAGEVTTRPSTHVVMFAGEHPCNSDGSEISAIKHTSNRQKLDIDLEVDHSFSNKPEGGYENYYHKMTTYVAIIAGQADAVEPGATAQSGRLVASANEESVFFYTDTASSRAGIAAATRKLEVEKVAIVGLGGTGSYVLDLVAKTPVKEIHLYDGDSFLQHNAFRSPGAPAIEELKAIPRKVEYFKERYSRMRRGIVAHDQNIGASSVDQLRDMSFVFLCMDAGPAKKAIVEKLEQFKVPFVDVGMGVELVEASLRGILRVTTSRPQKRDHLRQRVSFSDGGVDEDYDRNIQIADLNALNAALAVIKWKKLFGFYLDFEKEHHCTYTINTNMLVNEDRT